MALGRLSAGGGRHQSCSNCSEVIRNSTRTPQRAACSLTRLLQADRRALCVAHTERALESAGLPRMPPSSSLDSPWLAHRRQRSITTGGSNSSDNAAAALPEPSEPQCFAQQAHAWCSWHDRQPGRGTPLTLQHCHTTNLHRSQRSCTKGSPQRGILQPQRKLSGGAIPGVRPLRC